jgi:hypothetical protein
MPCRHSALLETPGGWLALAQTQQALLLLLVLLQVATNASAAAVTMGQPQHCL